MASILNPDRQARTASGRPLEASAADVGEVGDGSQGIGTAVLVASGF